MLRSKEKERPREEVDEESRREEQLRHLASFLSSEIDRKLGISELKKRVDEIYSRLNELEGKYQLLSNVVSQISVTTISATTSSIIESFLRSEVGSKIAPVVKDLVVKDVRDVLSSFSKGFEEMLVSEVGSVKEGIKESYDLIVSQLSSISKTLSSISDMLSRIEGRLGSFELVVKELKDELPSVKVVSGVSDDIKTILRMLDLITSKLDQLLTRIPTHPPSVRREGEDVERT